MDRSWTPDAVEIRLVEAFTAIRREASVARHGCIEGILSGERLTDAELISATMRLLSEHEEERTALIVWAKNGAGVSDLTVPQLLERRGWSRQVFDAKRHRGARIVCDGILAVRMLAA